MQKSLRVPGSIFFLKQEFFKVTHACIHPSVHLFIHACMNACMGFREWYRYLAVKLLETQLYGWPAFLLSCLNCDSFSCFEETDREPSCFLLGQIASRAL